LQVVEAEVVSFVPVFVPVPVLALLEPLLRRKVVVGMDSKAVRNLL
jgi:hypothetical protein